VRVPAVQGERAYARTLVAREEFCCGTCGLGKIFAHLLDPTDLHRWAVVGRLTGHPAGASNSGKPDAFLERTRQRWIGVLIEFEMTHRRVIGDRGQARWYP